MAEQKSNLLEEMKKQCDEYLAGWQRAKADYDNLEKQFARDRAELIKNANEDLILSLLPTLDNFEKAQAHLPDISSCSAEDQKLIGQWMDGMQNIYKQIFETLRQLGLERMEVLGKEFDPNTMEAVEQRQIDGRGDDEVVEEIVPGYRFNNKIIRPARVAVNKY